MMCLGSEVVGPLFLASSAIVGDSAGKPANALKFFQLRDLLL
jgi:hypothetical protein